MKFSLLFIAATATTAAGQVRNLTIDVHPLGGAITMAWRATSSTYAGIGLGLGTDELGRTIRPRDDQAFHDFEQLLYLDAIVRRKPGPHVDVDFGLRTGIGEVRNCRASDCLPGGYVGAFGAVFIGSAHWKLGTRLIGARVWEARDRDNVLHWDILTLRYSH